ncbi:hypothetical protein A2U01_0065871 [Trifolium medium]|uniref:Uncharacterized protein n=1 Tax=Trifolium medium TaxID=97028 RepID=A0A392S850_9FABA|nr:hypothetical protein [Trifolium medium]
MSDVGLGLGCTGAIGFAGRWEIESSPLRKACGVRHKVVVDKWRAPHRRWRAA